MNRISRKVLDFIREKSLVSEGDTVYLAVSGGADSVAMALILKDISRILKIKLFIINIEHGIRGRESIEDSEFVLNFAEKTGIPAKSISIDSIAFSKENGMSLEEGARVLRYRTIADFLKNREKSLENVEVDSKINYCLATAHHASDSVETTIFNMVRGTGLKGLSGISPSNSFEGIKIIRPILPLTKEEIENYIKENGFSFRHDSTNDDDEISRNYIRHVIIPSLSKLNERAVSNILECSEKVREASDYFSREAVNILSENKEITDDDASLDTGLINSIDCVLRPYIVFEWLKRNLSSIKDVSSSHVNAIVRLSENKNGENQDGKEINIPGRIKVLRKNGRLLIGSIDDNLTERISSHDGMIIIEKEEIKNRKVYYFSGGKFIFSIFDRPISKDFPRKNYTKWFDYDNIGKALCLRYRKEGDRICTINGRESVPLNRFFINEKLERTLRDSTPLLCDGSEVLWAVGMRISEKVKISERTKKILAVEYIDSEDLL